MRLYSLFISFLFSASTLAIDVVKVGIYDFPPYAFIGDKTTGITVQMIAAMNKFQNKYEFVAVPTTAKRRYRDFDHKKFDMMIFESTKWGWQNYPLAVSNAFVTGADVYVTQAKLSRGQDFFSDVKNKAIVGVLGYHYQFANFPDRQDYLKKNFKLLQTNNQKKVLELILNDRAEIGILPKEYLRYHFSNSPADEAKLLISDKFDQIYQHTILVRKDHKISINYINKLLSQMKKNGILKPLWGKYGLEATR
ncbi:MAG: polar amino acid transport system substrate-binding protein [Colwellia sp.]|jgi:polar amino acid transport system substrate-binding protein|tara:strand:- start:5522 stop:6274 length:753 start_codon:yes stop_codon:yes gene_type:complete